MSNKITEKYFDNIDFADRLDRVFDSILDETGFVTERELFRGKIYQDDKLGSVIFKGRYKNKKAVLKIQGIEPEMSELDIIESFNKQNKSNKIRLPKVYESKEWDKKEKFSYLVLEYIEGKRIFEPPMATSKQIDEFVDFYKELKSRAISRSFIKRSDSDKNVIQFFSERVSIWSQIALSQKKLKAQNTRIAQEFINVSLRKMSNIKMEFTHGHLSYDDVIKNKKGKYVLMSNLFWSYRPEYYDAVFNIWASIKSMRDKRVKSAKMIDYIEKWRKSYKRLPMIEKDVKFDGLFNSMMMERCVGALLVDIENQRYEKDDKEYKKHLKNIFIDIFNHYKKLI